ncbi:calcium-binding protein [Actinoplanes sp. NPDC048967]|uniref:calcium-binding protein n=1 Tax=Actinoplanes sp. NPDC048967 TaxID=3155269 RepID=UPI0033DF517E
MRRSLIAAGVVVFGVAVLPGAAQAGPADGRVWVTGSDRLQYQAAHGKQSRVVITRSGRTVTVDDKVAVKAGKGCKPVKGDRTKVRCTLRKTPTKITVNLGDRNDTLRNDSDLKLHVYGGTGKDSITGGPRADFVQGDAGNDKLYGRGGADSLYAGTGNDTVSGGDGDDFIMGEDGRDRLYGGAGGDSISGGDGDDWLHGGAGEDQLLGEGGKDTIAG